MTGGQVAGIVGVSGTAQQGRLLRCEAGIHRAVGPCHNAVQREDQIDNIISRGKREAGKDMQSSTVAFGGATGGSDRQA